MLVFFRVDIFMFLNSMFEYGEYEKELSVCYFCIIDFN